ncbi:MAG: FIG01967133: Putative secreted protein, partial [uncultured Blastococcus sp.]
LAEVRAAADVREALAGAVVGDADTALSASDAAISRATSTAWRRDPEGFRRSAVDLRSALDRLRGRVTLLAPADGTYSLGSTEAPLVLTVRNDLTVPVQVRLEVGARGTRGLSIDDIGLQTLTPGEIQTLQVPTEVRQSGGFAVNAQLTTPDGAPLGDRIQLQVRSTAYGAISLVITFGAAGLLGLLFLRRLVLFVLRRRAVAPADGAGAPEGAAVALPPNRSPV